SGGDVEVGVVPADDADDNASTVLVAVLIVAFVVVLIVAFSLAGRRSKPTTAATRPVSTISPRRQLLGNVQWLHDQLSLELLSAPGEAAAQRWLTERPRVDSMAIACQQTAAAGGGPEWQQLAARISGVARSLDTAIALRADPAADPTLVHEAIDAVNRNRANLMRSAQTANQSA
ncbi:MAG: hypothetical protein OEU32_01645, partial [Acidimicrobiia bacterium]|nr:hypothetical protein [Acidimicrobiia bacterium]